MEHLSQIDKENMIINVQIYREDNVLGNDQK